MIIAQDTNVRTDPEVRNRPALVRTGGERDLDGLALYAWTTQGLATLAANSCVLRLHGGSVTGDEMEAAGYRMVPGLVLRLERDRREFMCPWLNVTMAPRDGDGVNRPGPWVVPTTWPTYGDEAAR